MEWAGLRCIDGMEQGELRGGPGMEENLAAEGMALGLAADGIVFGLGSRRHGTRAWQQAA